MISHTKEVLAAEMAGIMKGLEMVGIQGEAYAKEEITKKGAVDTGRLRSSISHATTGLNSVVIGTNVEYAKYVELGTSKMPSRPYLMPAARDHTEEYKRIIKSALGG